MSLGDLPNWIWVLIFGVGAWCFYAGRVEGISYEKKRRAERKAMGMEGKDE